MRKRGVKSKRPTKELFYSYYDNKDLTVKEIAQIFKVSEGTIYRWSMEFNKENDNNLSDKQIYNRVDYNIKGRKKA